MGACARPALLHNTGMRREMANPKEAKRVSLSSRLNLRISLSLSSRAQEREGVVGLVSAAAAPTRARSIDHPVVVVVVVFTATAKPRPPGPGRRAATATMHLPRRRLPLPAMHLYSMLNNHSLNQGQTRTTSYLHCSSPSACSAVPNLLLINYILAIRSFIINFPLWITTACYRIRRRSTPFYSLHLHA